MVVSEMLTGCLMVIGENIVYFHDDMWIFIDQLAGWRGKDKRKSSVVYWQKIKITQSTDQRGKRKRDSFLETSGSLKCCDGNPGWEEDLVRQKKWGISQRKKGTKEIRNYFPVKLPGFLLTLLTEAVATSEAISCIRGWANTHIADCNLSAV